MTGIVLHTELRDFGVPERVLRRLADADTEPLMAEIGEYVLSQTLRNFDQEQTPDGERWTPSKRAERDGGKTLQDKGHLRDSYAYEASRDSVEIGSNIIYAAIHHVGGKAGRNRSVTIEPRPALGITEEDRAEIGEQTLDFYRRLVA